MTKRILIIDDDRDVAELTQIIIEGNISGVEIDLAFEMVPALAQISDCEGGYDLVISDFEIEESRGGLDITKVARAKSTKTKVLIYSGAMINRWDVIECCKADWYLAKPYDNRVLVAKVRELLGLTTSPASPVPALAS